MITIGSDPEMFITEAHETHVVSMCGIVDGTKDAPVQLGNGYAVQYDNVMLEYNVPPTTLDGTIEQRRMFLNRVGMGAVMALDYAQSRAPHLELAFLDAGRAWAELSHDYMIGIGDEVFRFGCSPDYDAYSEVASVRRVMPLNAAHSLWRSGANHRRFAGGHVHLGYSNLGNVPDHVVARLCDLFALPYVYGMGDEGLRGTYYGSMGRYRPTAYGIEYRTPSTNWVVANATRDHQVRDKLMGFVGGFEMVGWMLENMSPHHLAAFYKGVDWEGLRDLYVTDAGTPTEADRLAFCRKAYVEVWRGIGRVEGRDDVLSELMIERINTANIMDMASLGI